MPNMSAQALRTAVVQAAMADSVFRSDLEKDASKAIEARFGKQPYAIQFVIEKEGELSLLIPEQTEQMKKTAERTVRDLGNRKPTRGQFDALLIRRAWSDAGFLSQLKADARAALQSELTRYDIEVPAGKHVRAYIEQPGQCVILLPLPAAGAGQELSETELEAVAGGEGIVAISVVTIVATTTGVIVNEWVCESQHQM
jgi:hypothetical protein